MTSKHLATVVYALHSTHFTAYIQYACTLLTFVVARQGVEEERQYKQEH